jgi:hypothetical protein
LDRGHYSDVAAVRIEQGDVLGPFEMFWLMERGDALPFDASQKVLEIGHGESDLQEVVTLPRARFHHLLRKESPIASR